MKRFLTFGCLAALLMALVFAVTACDSPVSKVDSSGNSQAEGQSAAQEKTVFNKGDAVKVDDVVMTVTAAKQWKSKNEYEKPESGKVYYMVTISLVNKGSEKADYNALNYKIQDADGNQTDEAFVTEVPSKMNSGSLAPGGKFTGNLVFEVPKSMKSLKLIMEPNMFSDQQVTINLTK